MEEKRCLLTSANDEAKGSEGAAVVLNKHAVEHAHGAAASHHPPGHRLLGHLLIHMENSVLTVGDVAIIWGVERIASAGLVHLEILIANLLDVLVGVDANLTSEK